MLLSTFTGLLLAAATVSASSRHIRQTSNVVFKVTDFAAFEADPYIDGAKSNLTFHVSDTRPGFEAETNCVVPNTYFNLHAISALFDVCEKKELDFSYSYGLTGLTVRRGWRANE
ncbi:hypothetical protein CC80DRAFT_493681 [Byssothecium circinans]|uniref:AA1-like domain-containing protein n=1 Tax=Byssothecium circinans TaxID=147558 RepID=A0A6A5TS93_9PLEO|nr:hypothetical protein CC80DRAFT_493681 [Byssothecium circinans]